MKLSRSVETSQLGLSETSLQQALRLVLKAGVSVGVVLSNPCLESVPVLSSERTSDDKGADPIRQSGCRSTQTGWTCSRADAGLPLQPVPDSKCSPL